MAVLAWLAFTWLALTGLILRWLAFTGLGSPVGLLRLFAWLSLAFLVARPVAAVGPARLGVDSALAAFALLTLAGLSFSRLTFAWLLFTLLLPGLASFTRFSVLLVCRLFTTSFPLLAALAFLSFSWRLSQLFR